LVIERINERFGTAFGPELLLQARTVETQAKVLRERRAEDQVLVAFHREGDRCPLFLAHPAGGSVFGYDHVARALPERPVYGLQDPHIFAADGVFFESVEDMAKAYLPHLRRVQPHGPYLLGGWSLGGVLAFELANRLAAEGEKVARLVLFDAASPPSAAERRALFWRHVPAQAALRLMARCGPLRALAAPLSVHRRIRRRGWDRIATARELARFDLAPTRGVLRLFFPDASAAELDGGLDAILRDAVHRAEARDNIVPGVDPSNHVQRRRIHQRNLITLFRRYRPRWRYEGPTTLFRQPESAVAPWRKRTWAARYDWHRYCKGPLDVQLVELLATPGQPDPHDNTLLEINTRRYMPLVRAVLEQSEPR
jgi:thioesterase domain-containing protein